MTQAKHTPGPWQSYCDDFTGTYVASKDPTYDVVCHVKDDGNARLIAAAPDLLPIADLVAALPVSEEVADDVPVTGVNGVYITHGDVRAARAAIAKAKGETP